MEGWAVRTRGLTKRYGSRTVVDGLDLDVPTGSVCGVVGPNGAGKTTTIRMLLGLVRPTAGTGQVFGQSLDRPSAYLGQVGALVDGPAFQAALSGEDNLRVLALAGGLPRARVAESLARVGLAERASDRYRRYSLGMKQRLAIGAALLPRPRLLVLDEPANGLDPAGIVELRALLAGVRDEGVTVLVSSHLLAEVAQVADHLVVLRAGRLAFSGPLRALAAGRPTVVRARPELAADVDRLLGVAAALGTPMPGDDGQVSVVLAGDVDEPDAVARAAELNRRAAAANIVLAGLEVVRPSLEEAFFALTASDGGTGRLGDPEVAA